MIKRWVDTFVVGVLRFVKGALALALCLGTLGVALTVVGVSPAAAAGVPTITSVTPATGLPAGGTKVTIAGTNLTSATAVDFGTAAATISSNTAGKIVIDASPASPLAAPGFGTVDITVTTASGTSAIVPADEFTYVGAPTVTALYGGNAPTGGGTSIIIQGTNFVGVTAVDFSSTPSTSYTVQSSTQISAVVPPINNEAVGTVYNLTVTTGAGVSAKTTANQWYWFGTGSCTFSGTGVEDSGAPPGASAYIQDAVAGTSATNPSGGTAIPTSCTGLSGLGTTAPMIESLGAPTAAVVTGTGPGGNGGNEEWLGWSGANSYFDTTSATYDAPSPGFQLPETGPSTSGGCPISASLCLTGASGGTPVYYGTDPNATCPPSQAQTDAGLVDCSVVALTAESGTPPDTYIAATLEVSYTNDPTPDPATATFTPTTVAPGQTVTLNTCGTCNWWGAGSDGAPSFVPPIGPTGSATAIPAPAVWVGTTRANAVEASPATSTIAITPASYACGSSGGAATTKPGPTANCTLSQGTISGTFVMPTVTCSPCNVYVDEPNLSLTQSTYAADGGTGTYNNGLSYQLVNSVESTTTISCPTCNGSGGSTPTVTAVSPSSGPTGGGTSVTVTGTNFTGATAVDFGTSNPGSSIDVLGPTSLTVDAPPGSGTVDVTVTTPNGTSPANPPNDHYTYTAAAPTVTAVSPDNGPQAGGTSVTVTGSGFVSGSTTVDFGTTPGTSVDVSSGTSLTVDSPSGTGTVPVTVSTTGGGASTPLANAFTYNAAPTVTAVSPDNGPQAGGTSVTVTGSGFVSGSTTVDFGTKAGTSVDVSSGTSLTVDSPSGTGTVPVTVSTTGGGASTPLANAFTYNAAPTVTAVSPNNGPPAGGTSVTLTGTGFTGATAVDFGTTNPGSSIDVLSDTSLTVDAPSGSGTVDVTVTTPNGTSLANPPNDEYTYNGPPTVTAVSPDNGPQAGGTSVTVTGSGFVSGSTTVDFGTTPGTSVDVSSGTSLTVDSPSGTGTVPVTVSTTGGGASTPLADAFTYNAAPTVTAVSPDNGPQAGGTSVTVTGSGFVSGSTTVDFGTTPGTSVDVSSGTSLTVDSPSGTGTVPVTVSTTGGGASTPLANAFTYNAAPTVTAVSPDNGPQAGGTSVTVTGSGFVSGSTTVDFGTKAGTSVDVSSGTSLTVDSPSGTGTVPVTVVTTGGGASTPLANAFTYNAAPTVTAVSPNNGPPAGGTSVTLTGTGFTGATAVDFGTTNPGSSIDVLSDTSLTVDAPSGSGTVDVTVTTPNGTSLANPPNDEYTYNGPPTVTAVSPDNGPQAGGTSVTVTGSGFVSGSTTVDFGTTPGTSVDVSSGTSLTVDSPSGTGTVPVTVSTTGGGASTPLADAFTYNAAPTVTAVSPDNGPQAGGTSVTVTGSGFVSGSTTVDFGTTPGTSVDVSSGTSLTVDSPSGTGTVPVTVSTTGGGASTPLADAFTYNAAPTVTAVSPDNGPQAGGTSVTVTGSGFVSGSTTVDFGTTPGTSVDVSSGTSLTVDSPSGTGTVPVTVVTTGGGASTPLANAFTYNGPPTVTAVSPNNGPPAGGTSVTLTGTGFTGATAVDFGTTNPGSSIDVLSDTSLTVDAPSGSGTVDVTVTTPNGTSLANPPNDEYTYDAPPTVTAVSPDNGPQAGGTSVTVTGSGFVSGSTTVDFGTTPGTSVDVSSGTSLTVDSPSGTGTVPVTVSTTGGGASTPLADAFTYNAAPTVTAVSPDNGPQAGGTSVTVTGSGFVSGSTTVDFGTKAGTSVDVSSGTSLTVDSPSGTGTVPVTVSTTGGGASTPLADAFNYNAAPTVTAVSPDNGPQAGGTSVTVTGSGFVSGSTTVDFGTTPGTSVDVSSGTSLTVDSPSGTGTVSVTVSTTGGGASTPLADAFTYNGPPTVSAVRPSGGPAGGGTSVTLTGTGFTGATAVDFGASNPGTSVDVTSATSLTVISPPGTGTVNVSVTTPNGTGTKNSAFTYALAPTITSVVPSEGSTLGGTVVIIDGTNLASPSSVTFGGNDGTVSASSASSITVTTPAGSAGPAVSVVVTTFGGSVTDSGAFTYVTPVVTKPSTTQGYWEVAADGGIFSFGSTAFYGSTGSMTLNEPIVGMASMPDGGGYWLVAKDGGVFAYGDAHFYGSRGGQPLDEPIVGMASTPDGRGYWLVAKDGGVFAYGDARFYGSRGGQPLDQPIVGMASTPHGGGYWLVAKDGGVFAYGDARFYGSRAGQPLNQPIVGMAPAPVGGYWLVAKDGGVFAYGDAQFYGSAGGMPPNASVTGMASSPDGGGYWLATTDGGVIHYGDATSFGSEGSQPLNEPIVGIVMKG